MSVSIYDVAKRANVSIATVSRYLNGYSGIKDEKKAAVEQAIRELNYVPNELARGLAVNSSGMIGISISFTALEDSYATEILKGAVRYLENTPYSLVLINKESMDLNSKEPVFLDYAHQKRIDGIFLTTRIPDTVNPSLKRLIDSGFPIAYSGKPNRIEKGNVFSINGQRDKYLFTGLEHFYLKGHRSLGVFVFDNEIQRAIFASAEEQFRKKYGEEMSIHIVHVQFGDAVENFSNDFITRSVDFFSEKQCTGVFATSMSLAALLIRRYDRLKLSVPGDISVMGIQWKPNDEFTAHLMVDRICFSAFDQGYHGMEVLVRHLQGDSEAPGTVTIEYTLIEEGSVKNIK